MVTLPSPAISIGSTSDPERINYKCIVGNLRNFCPKAGKVVETLKFDAIEYQRLDDY